MEVAVACVVVVLRSDVMKLVVQVKLLPTSEQASVLEATLHACNRAATYASQVAFAKESKDRNGPQKEVYTDLKAMFGLSAQPAVRAVKKVVDAYATLRANLRAGNLGLTTSKRYRKAVGAPIGFRPEAAQPFDDRCPSWQYDARTVSIWTVAGRMRGIRFACSSEQLKTLVAHRKGESDLVRRGGKWFLIATCDLPDPEVYEPVDWIGVDRGIVNLATTSDGTNYQGRRLSRYRRWQARKRAELQRRKSRSARRRLARRKLRWTRPTLHSAVRAAGIPGGPTGPPGIIFAVVGAGSLAQPMSSPGSTYAIAHARRGCLSPHPHLPSDISRGLGGCDP
ncbi:transposase [Streptomyces indonesiensis]|uniref:Probable transposase IS891/IS1136/IS1341 domain-containing protein n=1 Tax=Streptomyces rhizosphaericus TaxID=114699 RepID=A0ABN1SFS2_9ACTN